MMATEPAQDAIVLFHYSFSPFARRVVWYLQLRGIPYAECVQPFILPRPDLESLGVNYRRIPLLAIGRDIYLDTRLILQKLEERFPDGKLGSDNPDDRMVEGLLQRHMIEGPVFWAATGLIPPDAMRDPKFVKDRQGFGGRDWTPESLERGRPECLSYIGNCFEFLESTVLADGREWVLKTNKPSLADIEAIWPFDWLVHLKGSMPPNVVSEKQFPKVFAWISRFRAALDDAVSSAPKPKSLDGPEAAKRIFASDVDTHKDTVDVNDALGLHEGEEVEVYPTDFGSEPKHRDRGRLVILTKDEVAIAKGGGSGGTGDRALRIHAPRTGFKVTKIDEKAASTKL